MLTSIQHLACAANTQCKCCESHAHALDTYTRLVRLPAVVIQPLSTSVLRLRLGYGLPHASFAGSLCLRAGVPVKSHVTEQTKMDWKNTAAWGRIYAFLYNASFTQPDGFNRNYRDTTAWAETRVMNQPLSIVRALFPPRVRLSSAGNSCSEHNPSTSALGRAGDPACTALRKLLSDGRISPWCGLQRNETKSSRGTISKLRVLKVRKPALV